jgi:hypothetical protein
LKWTTVLPSVITGGLAIAASKLSRTARTCSGVIQERWPSSELRRLMTRPGFDIIGPFLGSIVEEGEK